MPLQRVIVLLSALLLYACAQHTNTRVGPVPLKISSLTQAEHAAFIKGQGQLQLYWPEQRSARQALNNRRRFLAYAGQGELLIDMQQAQELVLKVNQQTLRVSRSADGQPFKLDLAAFTTNGDNYLQLVDIKPAEARVSLSLPFPTLREDLTRYSAAFAKVDELILTEVAQGFPGAVLLVAKDGIIIKHSAYGYAKRYDQHGQPLLSPVAMQPDTLFDLASNSKMYATNYALMHLVSTGKLNINLPIQHYLPEFQGAGREQIKVRDLLYNTAGAPAALPFFRPDQRHGKAFFAQSKSAVAQRILTQVPFAPAKVPQAVYSDIHFMLLGMLVERLVGQPLDTYVEHQFYQVLGLQQTMFNPLAKGIAKTQLAATELAGNSRAGRITFPSIRQDVVWGEVHDENAFYAFQGVAGHAGLFSSAADLAKLMAVALQGGGYGWQQFFQQSTLQQFTRPSPYDPSYGLGWRLAAGGELAWHFGAYASDYAYGHTGWTGTATVIDPAKQLIVVLLTNKKHSPILADSQGDDFMGDRFETGRYGSILTLIYAALAAL